MAGSPPIIASVSSATSNLVPDHATYIAFNSSGNLVGVSAGSPLPVTGSISASNPSVGTDGTAAPLSSTLIGTIDGSGNLQGASSANPVPISGTFSLPTGASTSALQTTGNSSLATIASNTPPLGQALAAGSTPVVLTAAQLSTLTPLSTVAVTGTFWQATQPVVGAGASGSAVSGNPVLMAGSDGTNARTILTDASGNQYALPVDSLNIGTFSLTSAATFFTQDTTGYRSISVQVTSAGTTCTITYEGSNDNATWLPVAGAAIGAAGNAVPVSTSTALICLSFPCFMRYFRARVSTYTSGTVTVTAYLRTAPTAITNMIQASQSTTVWSLGSVATSPGTSKIRYVSVASAPAAQVIKTTAGRLVALNCINTAAYAVYLKLYNIAAASVTVGTSAITYTFAIPATGSLSPPINDVGLYFSNGGWSFAITKNAADSDTTAVAAGDLIVHIDLV